MSNEYNWNVVPGTTTPSKHPTNSKYKVDEEKNVIVGVVKVVFND
jgi:hypothetical protein